MIYDNEGLMMKVSSDMQNDRLCGIDDNEGLRLYDDPDLKPSAAGWSLIFVPVSSVGFISSDCLTVKSPHHST